VDGFTAADAEDMAFRHLRTFGPFHETWWSEDHGAPIRSDRLRVCRPTVFAESSVTVEDTVGAPRVIKEFTEGAFLVSLCRQGETLVALLYSITPSAGAYRDGELRMRSWTDGGMAVSYEPIIRGREPYPSAEESVREVWTLSKRRVARLPRLMRPHPVYGPSFARWVLPIETAAAVTSANRRIEVRSLAFGQTMDRPVRTASLASVSDSIPGDLGYTGWANPFDPKAEVKLWKVTPRDGMAIFYAPVTAVEDK
jgi:hypothetical protein